VDSGQVQKVYWYQTEEFKIIIEIVMAALTIVLIIFFPPALPALLSLQTLLTAAIIIGSAVLVKYIFDKTSKWEWRLFAMIGGAMLTGWAAGGFQFDFQFDLYTALNLVNTATAAIDIYTKTKMEELTKKTEKFNALYEERIEEFEEVSKSIRPKVTADEMFNIVNTDIDIEQPLVISTDYYYYASLEMYLDFDLLYEGIYDSVKYYYDTQFKLTI
jgi:hypothetical protein